MPPLERDLRLRYLDIRPIARWKVCNRLPIEGLRGRARVPRLNMGNSKGSRCQKINETPGKWQTSRNAVIPCVWLLKSEINTLMKTLRQDSKSAGVHSPWGFKSLLRHHHIKQLSVSCCVPTKSLNSFVLFLACSSASSAASRFCASRMLREAC